MSIISTDSTKEPRSFSIGPTKIQLVDYVINSGETSGTITADHMSRMDHILMGASLPKMTAAPTFATNVATLAVTVPTETAATATIDGILYTAAANQGAAGNSTTVQLVDGTADLPPVTNGTETVFVTGQHIVVHIDPTAVTGSTRTNVRIAVNANASAAALVVASGTSATVATVTAATPLTGGVTGGARGTAICIGE